MIFPQCCKDSSQKHCVVSAPQKDFGFTALPKALPCSQPFILSVLLAQAKQPEKQNFPQQPPLGVGRELQGGVIQDKTHRESSGSEGEFQHRKQMGHTGGDQAKPARHQHRDKARNPRERQLREQHPRLRGDSDPGPGSAGVPRARGCSKTRLRREGRGWEG